jgi:hypothetical protein
LGFVGKIAQFIWWLANVLFNFVGEKLNKLHQQAQP